MTCLKTIQILPYINAHLGWMGNDLDRLSKHLDDHQNVITEIGAVLAEIGRQPKRARKFFHRLPRQNFIW